MDGVLIMSDSVFEAERYSQAPFATSVNMDLGLGAFLAFFSQGQM